MYFPQIFSLNLYEILPVFRRLFGSEEGNFIFCKRYACFSIRQPTLTDIAPADSPGGLCQLRRCNGYRGKFVPSSRMHSFKSLQRNVQPDRNSHRDRKRTHSSGEIPGNPFHIFPRNHMRFLMKLCLELRTVDSGISCHDHNHRLLIHQKRQRLGDLRLTAANLLRRMLHRIKISSCQTLRQTKMV